MDCIDDGFAVSDTTERLSLQPPFFPQHMTKSLFGHRHFHIVIIEYAIYIDYKGNRLEKTGCNLRGITGLLRGSPGGSEVKASACNAGDQDSIPGSVRSPGEGSANPLQYSCLENPMEGGA